MRNSDSRYSNRAEHHSSAQDFGAEIVHGTFWLRTLLPAEFTKGFDIA